MLVFFNSPGAGLLVLVFELTGGNTGDGEGEEGEGELCGVGRS